MPDDRNMRERLRARITSHVELELDDLIDAILDELRNPTETMIEAGTDYRPVSPYVRARDCWTAMLTAAKQERG